MVLIAPVPRHCLPFIFLNKSGVQRGIDYDGVLARCKLHEILLRPFSPYR